jgi:hypothetical protein
MPSVWVKWKLSSFDHSEITINDVLGEALLASGQPDCEALGDTHAGKMYLVETKGGVFVLCRRCCRTLGLPLHS